MPITPEHRSVETRFRELLASADLPEPDAVEYEPDSVLFRWHEQKLAVYVDLVTGEPRSTDQATTPSDRNQDAGCPDRRAAYDQRHGRQPTARRVDA
jgi:hypothetical protein